MYRFFTSINFGGKTNVVCVVIFAISLISSYKNETNFTKTRKDAKRKVFEIEKNSDKKMSSTGKSNVIICC
jgi:hypothetical protein